MGQNSSVAVGTPKITPAHGALIVDASDSFVSSIKLRSTGIIPISEYIKLEKCSKNIQKNDDVKINDCKTKTIDNKLPKENLRTKKLKADFIETSYEDIPARRQWVRTDTASKKKHETDAAKIGLKKSSKHNLPEPLVCATNGFREHNKERNRDYSRELYGEAIRNNVQIKDCVRRDPRTGIRRKLQESIGIGTQEFLNNGISQTNYHKTTKKDSNLGQVMKRQVHNVPIQYIVKESSTQTITSDKATSYDDVKQLYKRCDYDEKKRNRVKYHVGKELYENSKKDHNKTKQRSKPQRNYKERLYRKFEEESTHQFQTHEISKSKNKSKKYGKVFDIETNLSCSIPPDKHLQWKIFSNENQLERHAGRNYKNRKLGGAYYCPNEKYNDIYSLTSSGLINPSPPVLPSISALEQTIKEHRKYVSAKEALESWKNVHTWKQNKKRFERSRNHCFQNNLNVATQTALNCKCKNRSSHYLQLSSGVQEKTIVPSEKHLNPDFMLKMERCLQKHSKLCALNNKRNGDGKFTWVQDKYRKWHKITFDDYKK